MSPTRLRKNESCVMSLALSIVVITLFFCSSTVYAQFKAQEDWGAPGSMYYFGGAKREGTVLKIKEPIKWASPLWTHQFCWGPVELAAYKNDKVGLVVLSRGSWIPARAVTREKLSYELGRIMFGDNNDSVKSVEDAMPLCLLYKNEAVCLYGFFEVSKEENVAVFALYEEIKEGMIDLQRPDKWLIARYKGFPFQSKDVFLPPDKVPMLVKMLESKSNLARTYAAHVLAAGRKIAVLPLVNALRDSYSGVRINAARSLGVIGDKGSLGPLKDALEKEVDENVKEEIKWAIKKLEK